MGEASDGQTAASGGLAAVVAPAGAARGAGEVAAPRLLIIDDAVAVGRALARLARGRGWTVEVVATWLEGQRLLTTSRFQLVLVDYGLGGRVSGADAIAWLKRACPGVPAVLMSGSEAATDAATAVGCPALLKPFGTDELVAVLEAAARCAARLESGVEPAVDR